MNWLVLIAIAFPHPVDEMAEEVATALREPTQFVTALWPGCIGAIIGITLWLIARPDRP